MILIETTHSVSEKTALIEQSEKSVWLYIYGSNGIERDAFVVSLVQPNEVLDRTEMELGSPPTLIRKFASPNAILNNVSSEQFDLHWSTDGESVAAFFLGEPIAMIISSESKSYSKALVGMSGFGCEWNEEKYRENFFNG